MSETAPPGYFNVHKYSDPREKAGRKVFVSPSDSIADQAAGHAMSVSFRHEPSGRRVFFKAFISSLNESFSSDWTEEVVYGRTDPIQIFKSTTRRISLGLKVPAESFGEAYDNLGRVAQLTQFLYPNYTQHGSGMYPSQAPMLRLKVMNIIAKSSKDISPAANYSTYKSNADPTGGLLGNITSLTVNHNLETPDVTTFAKDGNTVLPGLIELSIDFVAMHEETLGWDKDKFNDESFPYGVTLMGATAAAAELRQLKVDIAKAMAPKIEDPSVALALGKEQQRLAAIKRYANATGIFSNPAKRLTKDLAWLAKNAENYNTGNMTEQQMVNYEYLKAASSYLTGPDTRGIYEFGIKEDLSWTKEGEAYTHYEMIDQ